MAAGVGNVIGTGFQIERNVSNLDDVNYTSITSFTGSTASNLPVGSSAFGIMIAFKSFYMLQMYITFSGEFAVYVRYCFNQTWNGETWHKL